MLSDRSFIRGLGCQYLEPDYHPGLDTSLRATAYCCSHDLVHESVYCRQHWPVVYSTDPAHSKKTTKRRAKVKI